MLGDCKKIESYKLKTDKINPPNTSGVVLYFLAAAIRTITGNRTTIIINFKINLLYSLIFCLLCVNIKGQIHYINSLSCVCVCLRWGGKARPATRFLSNRRVCLWVGYSFLCLSQLFKIRYELLNIFTFFRYA